MRFVEVCDERLHWIEFDRQRKRFRPASNPVAEVDKQLRERRVSIDVYSTEKVLALVRNAGSGQDGALFLTAAFTGLRMGELLVLRWRDVAGDPRARQLHASRARHAENRTGRTVPMIDPVAQKLAMLGTRAIRTADPRE